MSADLVASSTHGNLDEQISQLMQRKPLSASETDNSITLPSLSLSSCSLPSLLVPLDYDFFRSNGGRRDIRFGCCFIKYATSQEADRAIRLLHNQYTLPGGVGPIQVRYADGERERLGTIEFKLFVGSLNKHATEKEVEEVFAPYGRVEDVYLMRDDMKQSRVLLGSHKVLG